MKFNVKWVLFLFIWLITVHECYSQATLGTGTATKKSVVQCNVGNNSPVFLCSLFPEKAESCQLNLEFEEANEVVFSVIGPRSVHLTGYFLGSGGRHYNLNDESYPFNFFGLIKLHLFDELSS